MMMNLILGIQKDKNGKEYKNEPISIDYRKIYFMTNQLSLILVPKIKTQ